ncbi:MAG TPA: EamA family transporter [Candidatus Cybelea sp.]|jgi:drug/metabolite transporter (DMT)-like permease
MPWIALGIVYVFWGSTYLGIRVAVETIPPYLMTGVRYAIAGLLLLSWQWLTAKHKPGLPSRRELLRIASTAFLLLVVGNGLLCLSETRVESGTSALLIATTPIWMILLDALRARRLPSLLAVAGLIVGSVGIAVLVGRGAGHANALFAGLILLASLSWALGSVFVGREHHHPFTASLEMSIGGALCIVVGLASGEASQLHVAAISAASLWGMLWLITGGALVGYSAYAYVVRVLPTATVATYGYVNPIVAVILGALVLGERVTWNVLLGGVAVVLSVILILLGSRDVSEELSA